MEDKGRCVIGVTGSMIKENSKRLLKDINTILPEINRVSCKFTSGWFCRYKNTFYLKYRKVHGEAARNDVKAASDALSDETSESVILKL